MIEALLRKVLQENAKVSFLGQKASTQPTLMTDQSGPPTNRPTCAPHPDEVDENSSPLVIVFLTKQSNKLNCHWSRQYS